MPSKPFRGQPWTVDKLEFLEKYLPAFVFACKKVIRAGFDVHYVDGFSGSGLNEIEGQERLGSALIALNQGFSKFHFVEKKDTNFLQLSERVKNHGKFQQVQSLIHGDFNAAVDEILAKIDSRAPTFFLLDPTGLHLDWQTMAKIGARAKADVFVLVSASGVIRNVQNQDTITQFFGTDEWKKLLDVREAPEEIGKSKFSRFLDFYAQRLETLGFTLVEQHLIARNSTGAAMHGFIFASKHHAAQNIAKDVLEKLTSRGQDNLFG
jgi:three-Cys-motif partner protein